MQELIYTSAERGLKPGSRGFCTVASTPGMSKNVADFLEAISGYKHLFPPGDPKSCLNPVNYSHIACSVGGQQVNILSRIADAGLDYTHRTNKLAHHVVLAGSEPPSVGPAALMRIPDFFETRWEGEPRQLPFRTTPPASNGKSDASPYWRKHAGYDEWAWAVAGAATGPELRVAWIIYPPGIDVLVLFAEALAKLPPRRRWRCTFSTYFSKSPPGAEIYWRAAPEGSPEAAAARRQPHALVIDLARGPGVPPAELIELAKSCAASPPAISPSQPDQRGAEPSPPEAPAAEANTTRPGPPLLPSDANGRRFGPALPRQGGRGPRDRDPVRRSTWVLPAVGGLALLLGVGLGGVLVPGLSSKPTEIGQGAVAEAAGDNSDEEANSLQESATQDKPPAADTATATEGAPGPAESADAGDNPTTAPSVVVDKTVSENNAADLSEPAPPSPTEPTAAPKPAPQEPLPEDYFSGLRSSISLPLSLAGDGEAWTDEVEIGEIPRLSEAIDARVLAGATPGFSFGVTRSKVSEDLWHVTARQGPREPAEMARIRLHGNRLTVRWLQGDIPVNLSARTCFRSGFLVFQAGPEPRTKAVALREPLVVKKPFRFDQELGPIRKSLDLTKSPQGEPPIRLPEDSTIALAVRATGLPPLSGRTRPPRVDFTLIKSDEELIPVVSDSSLAIIFSWPASSKDGMPRVAAQVVMIPDNERGSPVPFTKKELAGIIEDRRNALNKEVDRLLEWHLNRAFNPVSTRALDSALWELLHNPDNDEKAQIPSRNNLSAVERYVDWLRYDNWKLNQRIQSSPKAPKPGRALRTLREKLPLERLLAWSEAADSLSATEFHLRVTHWLSAQASQGVSPRPSADLIVVGDPPKPKQTQP